MQLIYYKFFNYNQLILNIKSVTIKMIKLSALQEISFLLHITAILLGFQLALYFFYRFFKISDERLPLNRILLSFGCFYLFLILGLFILTINEFFVTELIVKEIFFKTGYISILISPITFMYFILIQELKRIINFKFLKYFMLILLIPIVIIAIFPIYFTIVIIIAIGMSSISAIYILFFQIRLIHISRGDMRIRLTRIFIGNAFVVSSLFFLLEIITSFFNFFILSFIGISLIIIGMLLASFGVYGFPALFEYRWKENLLKLFVINRKNNACLYAHDFSSQIKDQNIQNLYKELFSGGITGINKILSAITNTQTENIYKIEQSDSLILLEYGSNLIPQLTPQLTYALIVKKDLKTNHYFLRSIKYQFETFFKEILTDMDKIEGNIELLFRSFDLILNDLMVD